MSVDYCEKHHHYYDTDFETECYLCEENKDKQLPYMTLKQAIEKAKPNMDKIKDVDKHIESIR